MIKPTAPIILAAALLFATACHKDNKAAQLQALEKAYKSGVFSKEEYDAKRQVLLGPPPAAPAATPAPAPAVVADGNPPASAGRPADGGAATPPAFAPPDSAPSTGADQALPPPSQPAGGPPPFQPSARQTPVQQPPVQQPPVQALPPQPRSVTPKSRPPAPPNTAEAEEPEPAPLAGCDDREYRKSGGPKGTQERFYPASVEAVRKATESAFQNLDFVIHIDTANDMEASRRRHIGVVIGAGGERLVLHFSRLPERPGRHEGDRGDEEELCRPARAEVVDQRRSGADRLQFTRPAVSGILTPGTRVLLLQSPGRHSSTCQDSTRLQSAIRQIRFPNRIRATSSAALRGSGDDRPKGPLATEVQSSMPPCFVRSRLYASPKRRQNFGSGFIDPVRWLNAAEPWRGPDRLKVVHHQGPFADRGLSGFLNAAAWPIRRAPGTRPLWRSNRATCCFCR